MSFLTETGRARNIRQAARSRLVRAVRGHHVVAEADQLVADPLDPGEHIVTARARSRNSRARRAECGDPLALPVDPAASDS